ncbi:hypothetical protein [Hyphococcus sp. DH-69]|uniref:hypothetical protein n=1 Tax=Hyphococcus formosus TaxID=3143534 RepID=UPI00398ACFAA
MSHEIKNDNASALLQLAKLKRAPWDVVSSMELADLTGLSIQVLANWRIRKKGPSPVPRAKYRGNKTYYRVFEVERWLRDLPVTQGWRVVAEWLMQKYYFPDPLRDEGRTWRVVDQLIGWKIWPLAHHPRRTIGSGYMGVK